MLTFAKNLIADTVFGKFSPRLERLNHRGKLLEWIRSHPELPVFEQRFELYAYVQNKYVKDGPMDYLEFGVFDGASFRRWLDLHRNPESRFFGFDTFTGLPTAWENIDPKGRFNVDGKPPEVNDPRAQFMKGLFQETLPGFLKTYERRGRMVIHNDSDLYSSTAYMLANLNIFLKAGDIILFDEFSCANHEMRAWEDYLEAFMRKAEPIGRTSGLADRVAFVIR